MRSHTLLACGLGGVVLAAGLAATPMAAHAQTIQFVPCSGANGGAEGLRQALATAQGSRGVGSGIIELAQDCSYVFGAPTTGEDSALVITGKITILGKRSTITRRTDAPLFRIFEVDQAASLTLEGVTVSGGVAPTDDIARSSGGGILSAGTLVLKYSTVTENQAVRGGGISTNGPESLTLLYHSVVSVNRSVGQSTDAAGGGIDNDGTLKAFDTVISSNASAGTGGGMRNIFGSALLIRTLVVNNLTVTGGSGDNRFVDGGGIANVGGLVQIRKSRITDNVAAGDGGGLFNVPGPTAPVSAAEIRDSLIADNAAARGGGIWNEETVNLIRTRVIRNTPDNCAGTNPISGCPGDFTTPAASSVRTDEAASAATLTSDAAVPATDTRPRSDDKAEPVASDDGAADSTPTTEASDRSDASADRRDDAAQADLPARTDGSAQKRGTLLLQNILKGGNK